VGKGSVDVDFFKVSCYSRSLSLKSEVVSKTKKNNPTIKL